jgi:hypothetical protein
VNQQRYALPVTLIYSIGTLHQCSVFKERNYLSDPIFINVHISPVLSKLSKLNKLKKQRKLSKLLLFFFLFSQETEEKTKHVLYVDSVDLESRFELDGVLQMKERLAHCGHTLFKRRVVSLVVPSLCKLVLKEWEIHHSH